MEGEGAGVNGEQNQGERRSFFVVLLVCGGGRRCGAVVASAGNLKTFVCMLLPPTETREKNRRYEHQSIEKGVSILFHVRGMCFHFPFLPSRTFFLLCDVSVFAVCRSVLLCPPDLGDDSK